jgi:hypothetical protein
LRGRSAKIGTGAVRKNPGSPKADKSSRKKGGNGRKSWKEKLDFEGFKKNLCEPCLTNNQFLENLKTGIAILCQAFPNLSGFSLLLGTPWQN